MFRWVPQGLLLTLGAILLIGCSSSKSSDESNGNTSPQNASQPNPAVSIIGDDNTEIPLAEPPLAKDVFGVVRDEQGYILADMGPEVEKMAGHTEESIKKYLRRRGVQLLADKRKTEKPLQSQKSFLVRMIVVVSTDEYDQAQWATAPELAQILFVHPPVEIDAAALNDGDLRKIIQTEKIDLRAYNTVSDP